MSVSTSTSLEGALLVHQEESASSRPRENFEKTSEKPCFSNESDGVPFQQCPVGRSGTSDGSNRSTIFSQNTFPQELTIDPKKFYSSPRKRKADELWQEKLKRLRVVLDDETLIDTQRRAIYEDFSKQHLAFEFRDLKQDELTSWNEDGSLDLHIFAYEIPTFTGSGCRRYVVSTYDEFWRRYNNLQSGRRHFYEVLEEGKPCHLYLDLEYMKDLNPGLNGAALVDQLLRFIFIRLMQKYNLQCKRQHVVILESSSLKKFSQHVILRIPGAVWKNNIHAGAFIYSIVRELQDRGEENPLIINSSTGQKASFIDMGTMISEHQEFFGKHHLSVYTQL